MLVKHYYHILAAILTVGCLLHPASFAAALSLVFLAHAADKYFTKNISDKERIEIDLLKSEVDKLKVKSSQQDLKNAFSGR